MIQVKKITLTPAIIVTLSATPNIVLPAPPAGSVNNILGVSHDMTYAGTAYAGGTTLRYGSMGAILGPVFQETRVLVQTQNFNMPATKGTATQIPFSTTKDFFLDTATPATTGNSNVDVYIIYEVKVLD